MQVTRGWTVLTAGSMGGLDVKIKGRTDDGSMRQLDDWLAEPREDGPTKPAVPVEPHAEPDAKTHAGPKVRAVIGDQLRLPVMWCEIGSCISCHADPAALGEGDIRARALDAGWRIDAFGRLACPRCQQTNPSFRACYPVVPWDRGTAMTRTARIVAGRGELMALTGGHPGTGQRGH
jgi:hypothetical protein